MKKILSFLTITLFYFLSLYSQNNNGQQLYKKGIEEHNKGNLKQAVNYLEQAAKIFQQNNQTKNYLIAKLTIADFYITNGNYNGEAKEILNNIKKEYFKQFSHDSLRQAQFLSIEAKSYYLDGNYNKALKLTKKSLKLKEKFSDNQMDILLAYNDLGNIYAAMEQYKQAKYYFLKVIKKYEQKNIIQDFLYSMTLHNLANAYYSLNQLDSALIYEQQAIKYANKIIGENNIISAAAYSGIAQIYSQKAQQQIAYTYILKAINLKKNIYGENTLSVADEYINLANILYQQEKYQEALSYNFEALKIYQNFYDPNNINLVKIYINIALDYLKFGSLYNAQQFLKKALYIQQTNGLEHSQTTAKIYANLSIIALKNKDDQKTLEFAFKSYKIFKNIYGENNRFLIVPYYNIANVYLINNKFNKAIKYFKLSLSANNPNLDTTTFKITNQYFDGVKIIETFNGLMKCYFYQSDKKLLEKTLLLAQKSDSLITKTRVQITDEKDKLRLNEIAVQIYDIAVATAYKLYHNTQNEKFIYQAFYYAERAKATLLLRAIYNTKINKTNNIPQHIINRLNTIKIKIKFYQTQLLQTFDQKKSQTYINLLVFYQQQLDSLITYIKNKYPDYYKTRYNIIVANIKDLQQNINKKTAIIEYTITETDIFAIVITKNKINFYKIKKFTDFDISLYNFYNYLNKTQQANAKTFEQLSNKLYKQLLFFNIDKKITHLLIIPDKQLNTIPFEVLTKNTITSPTYQKLNYLIRSYSISYHYSATLFFLIKKYQTSEYDYTFLGVAPIFEGKTARNFNDFIVPALPGTKTEVDSINKFFINNNLRSIVLLSEKATMDNFTTQLNKHKFKIIHLATHGFINPQNPELSALLFANNNGLEKDLYLSNIYALKIDADLVVLSACQTGTGKISNGEGVIGLARAFIFAGTHNLIISLWQVSDQSTKKLMLKFYYNIIIQQKNYHEALKKAKLSLINNTKFSHPFYWASFVLIGH